MVIMDPLAGWLFRVFIILSSRLWICNKWFKRKRKKMVSCTYRKLCQYDRLLYKEIFVCFEALYTTSYAVHGYSILVSKSHPLVEQDGNMPITDFQILKKWFWDTCNVICFFGINFKNIFFWNHKHLNILTYFTSEVAS